MEYDMVGKALIKAEFMNINMIFVFKKTQDTGKWDYGNKKSVYEGIVSFAILYLHHKLSNIKIRQSNLDPDP